LRGWGKKALNGGGLGTKRKAKNSKSSRETPTKGGGILRVRVRPEGIDLGRNGGGIS